MNFNFLLNNYSGKNILITGGTGLIGRQVVEYLSDINCNIKVVSLDKFEIIPSGKKANINKLYGDLCDFNFCKEITNDIVQLIAASPQAMEDFATIATQQDVDQFNKKYNVNLVLPQEA